MITGSTRLAAVIGSPVQHSLSPIIHNAAFAECRIDGTYVALPVDLGRAAEAVSAMRLFGWYGLSVTMPHKQNVLAACDELTAEARDLGAANCLFWQDDQIVGTNTDGQGFVRGLDDELGESVVDKRCAVVGAGGAARAVIRALASTGAAQVTVINRSSERAASAALLAGATGHVGSHQDLASADLVINATSIGMASTDAEGSVPFDVAALAPDAVVSDLIYHPWETPLLVAARARGHRSQNGLAMLVFQAATQFELWTGTDAPTKTMMAAARSAIGSSA